MSDLEYQRRSASREWLFFVVTLGLGLTALCFAVAGGMG